MSPTTSDWQHATNAVESHTPQPPSMPALIKLTNLIHIPVSCIQTKTEVTSVLEEMHLGGFLHESHAVPQVFLNMLTQQMDSPDDPDNLHPVVYFLAALVRQPLPHVLQLLKFQSPISIIMRRVSQEPPGASSTHRDRLVGVYADFGRLTGDDGFVGQLYDVAGGNEVLIATSLILCLLNAFSAIPGVRQTHSPDSTQEIEVDDPVVLSVVDNLDLDAPVTAAAAPSRWGSGWSLPRMAGFLGLYNSPKASTGIEVESRRSSMGAGVLAPSEVKASPAALKLDQDCADATSWQQAAEVDHSFSEKAPLNPPTNMRSNHTEEPMQEIEHQGQPGAWPNTKQHSDQLENQPNRITESPVDGPSKHSEMVQKPVPAEQPQPVEQTKAKQPDPAEQPQPVEQTKAKQPDPAEQLELELKSAEAEPQLVEPEPQLVEPEPKPVEPEPEPAEPEPEPAEPQPELAEPQLKPVELEQPTPKASTESSANQPCDVLRTASHTKDAGPLSSVSLNTPRPQNVKHNDDIGPPINDASRATDTGSSKKKKKKKKKAAKDELSDASKSPEPARETPQADGGDEGTPGDRPEEFDPQVVAMISEQLPHVPYDRLVEVLVANDFDLDALTPEVLGRDVSELSGASERGRSHSEQCLLFLTELFPKLEVGYLEYQLRANHGDLDRTCEAVTALTEGRPRPQSAKQASSPPVWNKMTDDAARLQEWTGVSHATANSFLHKHKLKVYEALVDIIKHYRPHAVRDAAASMPRGGRVQHGQAVVTTRSTHRQAEPMEPYVYDANSEEAKELRAIYLGNKAFREKASEGFFERALVFYRGDYMKVVDIALLLNENGALELASASPAPPAPAKAIAAIPKAELASTQRLWSERARSRNAPPTSIARTPQVGGSGGVTTVKAVPAIRGTLDFHGYTVREAVTTLEKAIGVWWSEEVSSRHADGRLDKFGSMAQFVDPLTIITGRGLHSAAGVAKVRPAVIKWLSKKGFVFEESSSAVVVTGKRR